jgi:hypothetical protein
VFLNPTINNRRVEVTMRTLLGLCIGAILVISSVVYARAGNVPANRFVNATIEQSEQTLCLALQTDSDCLRLSAANTVRQLKDAYPERSFSSLVIPLMRILKDGGAEPACRIVAAITLHELHSAIGDFAISRTAQFTDNPSLQRVCLWLWYYRSLEDNS